MQGDSAKGLGSVTVGALGLTGVLAVYFVYLSLAEVFQYTVPERILLEGRTRSFVPGAAAAFVLALSMVLYLALAFGANKKAKDTWGDDYTLWPRPDWAWLCAMVSGSCILAISYRVKGTATSSIPYGYMPI
mmetsp:Transcript_14597/g.31827  ORF Transcript_14597/g.31827 Transcript_14597/m.31827 type:complete len:132 (+) Transcript_14597:87-482(+)